MTILTYRLPALLSLLSLSALDIPMNAAEPNPPTSPAAKILFGGKDVDGWQHIGPGRFVLDNGLLKTEGGMGLLWYQKGKTRRLRAASGL